MPIINTGFKEISILRNKIEEKEIKLGKIEQGINIIDISKVEQVDFPLIRVEYEYKTTYNLDKPKGKSLGEIKIVGEIFYKDEQEKIDKILKSWENKKIDRLTFAVFANAALTDANIEALQLAKKVRLPLPVALPRIRVKIAK